MIYSAN